MSTNARTLRESTKGAKTTILKTLNYETKSVVFSEGASGRPEKTSKPFGTKEEIRLGPRRDSRSPTERKILRQANKDEINCLELHGFCNI